jgi:hypothetical protein
MQYNKPNLSLEVKMFRNGTIFRVIGVLVLVGLILAGGFAAYRFGVAQGIAQAPEVATAISQAAESGQPIPPMYSRGYGFRHPFGYPHHFGFFPFGGICLSILFVFLFLGLLRFAFFRPWHHGGWGRKWEGGIPPMFDEWHKRAHGEAPTESGNKDEK